MTERERFEQWISTRKLCKKYGAKLDLLPDGLYRDVRVRGLFSTWQAARAASPKVPHGVEEAACSPTKGMNLGERIKHVGGRENEAGYIEFGSVMAVDALINHVLRDVLTIPKGMALVPVEPTDKMIDAAEKVDWSSSDTKASIINMWQAMLAATKEKGE